MSIMIISLVFMAIGMFVQYRLRSKFDQYTQIPFRGNMTGAELAERMLRENNITDVKVQSVGGKLTDHYNPFEKTVNLSPEVYSGRSVSAAAVAAHECGHAVQYARGYAMIGLRSRLVPVVSFASSWVQWVLLGGVLLLKIFPWLLLAGIIMFAFTTLFAFITLPVEFDASNRALAWLEETNLTTKEEHGMAKDALKWAALTYVVAAISSLVTLLYYLQIFMGGRRRD